MLKLVLSSIVGIGASLVVAPKLAYGSSAHATFKKMRSAVLASAQHDLLFSFKLGNNPNDPVQAWVVQDGNLVEINPGHTYESDHGGSKVIVIPPGGSSDLSSLTPEVRKAVQDAMKKAAAGGDPAPSDGSGVHITASVDGAPMGLDHVKRLLKAQGIHFDINIDLNEDDYASITYGKDLHTLVLLPKRDTRTRSVIQLDPKSNLPTCLTIQRQANGKWIDQRI